MFCKVGRGGGPAGAWAPRFNLGRRPRRGRSLNSGRGEGSRRGKPRAPADTGIFDKIWLCEQPVFREKSEKKGILLTFMPHKTSFDRINVFWPYMGMRVGGFYEKFWKKKTTWEHFVF